MLDRALGEGVLPCRLEARCWEGRSLSEDMSGLERGKAKSSSSSMGEMSWLGLETCAVDISMSKNSRT